jgi:hypothetical protein
MVQRHGELHVFAKVAQSRKLRMSATGSADDSATAANTWIVIARPTH